MKRSRAEARRAGRRRALRGALSLLGLLPRMAPAAEPLVVFNVLLLQPSRVLEARVPDVDAMATYIQAVQAAATQAVLASGAQQAVGGYIVVAVRPGGQSMVWLDFDAMLDLSLRSQLLSRIQAVQAFEASGGTVVFALQVATWKGHPPKRAAPAPQEWKNAARGEAGLDVGDLAERAWPAGSPTRGDPGLDTSQDLRKTPHAP